METTENKEAIRLFLENRPWLKARKIATVKIDAGVPDDEISLALGSLGACVAVWHYFPSAKSRAARHIDCITQIGIAVFETPVLNRVGKAGWATADEIAEYVAGLLNCRSLNVRPGVSVMPVFTKITDGPRDIAPTSLMAHFEAQTVIPPRDD